jgi:Uma2 family endonuclease
MASLPTTKLTEEQYLEIERLAETKSEFHDGQMFAMSGGTLNHSLLATKMSAILLSQVPNRCRTFNSELRIKVVSGDLYPYPDCGVFCGEPQFFGDRRDILLNPTLLVEVLSPSAEGYDRGKKFELYRTIPSFLEYLVVHQDTRHFEHYSKQGDGSWVLRDYIGAEASVPIHRLNAHVPLADLYANAFELD